MFEDREQAGFLLARKLAEKVKDEDLLILGLTRGGIIPARVIAAFLEAPLNGLVVKKIGSPTNPELAIGAVGPKNTVYWNDELLRRLKISNEEKSRLKILKEAERKAQEKTLIGEKALEIFGKTAILVDDGVATGATVIVSAKFIRRAGAKKVILAVPVIAKDVLGEIKKVFDMIVALKTEKDFYAVGQFYKEFTQVENEEVKKLLG